VKLRHGQLKAILDYMSVKSKVKCLHLLNMDFGSVDMNMFESPLATLTSLSFAGTTLDEAQLKCFIETISSCKGCNLKALGLSSSDMKSIEPNLLSRVLTSIESVRLDSIDILVSQLEVLFVMISEGETVVKCLDLEEIDAVYEVNPKLLAKAVNELEYYQFGSSSLSENQTTEIFKVMSCGTRLKMLGTPGDQFGLEEIEYINEVDPVILAKAVNNLESVRLNVGDLSLAQCVAIFKQLSKQTKLRRICKYDYDLEEEVILML